MPDTDAPDRDRDGRSLAIQERDMSDDLVERLNARAAEFPGMKIDLLEAATHIAELQAEIVAARAELEEIKSRDGEEELQRIWEMLKRYGIDDHSVFVAAKRGAQAFAELTAARSSEKRRSSVSDNPGNLSRESRRILNADPLLCEDCPPVEYPTDKTRCGPCPRRAGLTAMQRLAIVCGNEPYAEEQICPTCNGSGHVPFSRAGAAP